MKLIAEHSDNLQYIVEGSDNGNKKFIIDGIFMQADKLNRNRRIYPKLVLEKAVDKFITEKVNTRRAVGELNHPEGPAINLDKVSHRITELSWNGNDVMGKALILNTPMGNIVKGLIEGGCQLGVSSRGMGTVGVRNGRNEVNDDFFLSTIDIVQDPSAPSAFVNGIMEGVEYFYEGSQIVAVTADKYKSIISKMSKKQITENQIKMFDQFLKEIF